MQSRHVALLRLFVLLQLLVCLPQQVMVFSRFWGNLDRFLECGEGLGGFGQASQCPSQLTVNAGHCRVYLQCFMCNCHRPLELACLHCRMGHTLIAAGAVRLQLGTLLPTFHRLGRLAQLHIEISHQAERICAVGKILNKAAQDRHCLLLQVLFGVLSLSGRYESDGRRLGQFCRGLGRTLSAGNRRSYSLLRPFPVCPFCRQTRW